MKPLLNRYNLPAPFVDAVMFDNYTPGDADYTTTKLLRPPRIVQLERQHWNELTPDVIDKIWTLSGQVKHMVLERAAKANPDRYIVEKRYSATVNDLKISGQIDLYEIPTKTLYDWKESSVWKVMVGDHSDWIQQGNINRYILSVNGIPVEKIVYMVFFKDWKRRDAEHKPDYPQVPVQQIEIELWPQDKALQFITERIAIHESAKTTEVFCTAEDRWERPEKFAAIKKGAARASKLFDNVAEARQYAVAKGLEVEHRPAEQVRCDSYCPVADFCVQLKKLKGQLV